MAPRPPQLDLTGNDAGPLAYTACPTSARPPIPSASTSLIALPASTSIPRMTTRRRLSNPWQWRRSCHRRRRTGPGCRAFAAAALSSAQLETIVYAGQSFERDLSGHYTCDKDGLQLTEHADGAAYRQGYFLGDGTGAGKGRQVAGIISGSMVAWSQAPCLDLQIRSPPRGRTPRLVGARRHRHRYPEPDRLGRASLSA